MTIKDFFKDNSVKKAYFLTQPLFILFIYSNFTIGSSRAIVGRILFPKMYVAIFYSIAYLLLGISSTILFSSDRSTRALIWTQINLFSHLLFLYSFFTLEYIILSSIIAFIIFISILSMIYSYYKNSVKVLLLILPYIVINFFLIHFLYTFS